MTLMYAMAHGAMFPWLINRWDALHLHYNQPTPWHKLMFHQIVNKLFNSYSNGILIIKLTRAHCSTSSWATRIQSTPDYSNMQFDIAFHSIPGSHKWSIIFRFCDQIFVCISLSSLVRAVCFTHLPLHFVTLLILRKEQKSRSSSLCNFFCFPPSFPLALSAIFSNTIRIYCTNNTPDQS
jgi:hypothetical protein